MSRHKLVVALLALMLTPLAGVWAQGGTATPVSGPWYYLYPVTITRNGDIRFIAQATSSDLSRVYTYSAADGTVSLVGSGTGRTTLAASNKRGDYIWSEETAPNSYRINIYLHSADGGEDLLLGSDAQSGWLYAALNEQGDAAWYMIVPNPTGGWIQKVYLYTAADGAIRPITGQVTAIQGVAGITEDRKVAYRLWPYNLNLYDDATGQTEVVANDVTTSARMGASGVLAWNSRTAVGQGTDCYDNGAGGQECYPYTIYEYSLNVRSPAFGVQTVATANSDFGYYDVDALGDVVWQWREDYNHDFELFLRDGATGTITRLTDDTVHDQGAHLNAQGDLAWAKGISPQGAMVRLANTGEVVSLPLWSANPNWPVNSPVINDQLDAAYVGGYWGNVYLLVYHGLASNTPAGPGVAVTPTDSTTGQPAPITLTFDNVTQGGDTTVTSSGFGQGPPTDYILGFPPVFYDITTTAQYTGSVEVCMTYDEGAFFFENNLKLFHNENGTWKNVTTSLDTTANVICGLVSSLSPFTVLEGNGWPTAVIADPGMVILGVPTVLDGTGSSDPEGEPLTFQWNVQALLPPPPLTLDPGGTNSVPSTSPVPAELTDADTPNPTLIVHDEGDYMVVLTVSDGHTSVSTSRRVSVSNMPPTADAGPDQAIITVPADISLDGSHSSDPEGSALAYQWSFASRPPGSAASIVPDSNNPALAGFTADVRGTYEVQLIVIDEFGEPSAPDTMLVSYENVAPVADAGADQAAVVGDQVSLSGSGTDANGDALGYAWALTTVPEGSLAALVGANTATPSFGVDLPGTYVAQLIVSDGALFSAPDTVVVEVITVKDAAVQTIAETVTTLGGLPDRNADGERVFRNRQVRKTLTRKLLHVLHRLEHNAFGLALLELQLDVLPKVDGCARRGAPDRSDWIRTCDEQLAVYDLVTEAIRYVQELPHHRRWHRQHWPKHHWDRRGHDRHDVGFGGGWDDHGKEARKEAKGRRR